MASHDIVMSLSGSPGIGSAGIVPGTGALQALFWLAVCLQPRGGGATSEWARKRMLGEAFLLFFFQKLGGVSPSTLLQPTLVLFQNRATEQRPWEKVSRGKVRLLQV